MYIYPRIKKLIEMIDYSDILSQLDDIVEGIEYEEYDINEVYKKIKSLIEKLEADRFSDDDYALDGNITFDDLD
jgi:hypothetical protein